MNYKRQDFEIDEINFWDREMTKEELLYFRYSELKKLLYTEMGIPQKMCLITFLCKLSLKYLN